MQTRVESRKIAARIRLLIGSTGRFLNALSSPSSRSKRERRTGVEPASLAWKVKVLHLGTAAKRGGEAAIPRFRQNENPTGGAPVCKPTRLGAEGRRVKILFPR